MRQPIVHFEVIGKVLVVAHFTDPQGNLIGLAGPA